jgi:predicted P-loop ATPase
MAAFATMAQRAKNIYVDPTDLGLKVSSKLVGGQVIETVRNSRFNVAQILRLHPRYNSLHFNSFNQRLYFNGKTVDDNMLNRECCWMENVYEIRPSPTMMMECMNMVGEDRHVNPLMEQFIQDTQEDGTIIWKEWDGVPRLEFMLERYFGGPPTKITRAYSKRWMIGAIRRALFSTIDAPVKMDTVLVLNGRQGLRKSTAVEILALKQEWFGDMSIDMSSKDYVQHLNGKFIYELKELARRLKDKELEKSVIDQKVDAVRFPYTKCVVYVVRRTSFIATTNRMDILSDPTGSRRWWPVICGCDWTVDEDGNIIGMVPWGKHRTIDTDGLRAIREQLWLEALHYARKGEQHWLTNEEEDERLKSRDAFVSHHPWFHQIKTMVAGKDVVSVNDVLILLSIPLERQDHKSRLIIESSLQELGYSKTRVRDVNGSRPWKWKKNGKRK